MIISKNSVLGDSKVRAVLIGALSEHVDDDQYAMLFKKTGLDRCVRMIGVQSAWRELGVFEAEELREIIVADIFKKVIAFGSRGA